MSRYVVSAAAALILVSTSGSLLLGLVALNAMLWVAGRWFPELEETDQ